MFATRPNAGPSSSGPGNLGASALLAGSFCPLSFGFRVVFGLTPVDEPEDRLRGTLAHAGLAYHYASRLPAHAQPAWFQTKTLEEEWKALGRGRIDLVDDARRATNYFSAWASSIRDPWRPLAVEQQFSATIGELDPAGRGRPSDNIIVDAKLDLVAQTPAGHVLIVDHKTTVKGTRDGRLWGWSPSDNRYMNSFATLLYFAISTIDIPRKLNVPPPTSFVIQRMLTMPPFDVDRNDLRISPMALANVGRAARQHAETAMRHFEDLNAGRELVPSFSGCSGCDYKDICHSASPEDRVRAASRFYAGTVRTSLPMVR